MKNRWHTESEELISQMSFKRLMRYKRGVFKRIGNNCCDCGCGEPLWDLYPDIKSYKELKVKVDKMKEHLKLVNKYLEQKSATK